MSSIVRAFVVVVTLGWLAGSITAGEASEPSFTVGVAARDVTPEPGLAMAGYSARQGVSTGTRDPLQAKAVVMGDGTHRLALVQLDWIGPPGQKMIDDITRVVKAEAGVEDVFVIGTHTHSGPATAYDASADGSGALPHLVRLKKGLTEAIVEASRNAAAAKIAVGRGTCRIAHNRRAVRPDGSVFMLWANMERVPTSPVDPEVGVIRIEAQAERRVIATLVSFACHPVVFGPDHLHYSADYVGEMARAVEKEQGGMCIFLQGAAGDQNPYADKRSQSEDAEGLVKAVGLELAEEVNRVSRMLRPQPAEHPSIQVKTRAMLIQPRYDLNDPKVVARLEKILSRPVLERYRGLLERYSRGIEAPLGTIILNGNLAFATFPGEFFIEFQQDLKRRSPIRDTFFLGYANESFAYFPTLRAISEGGYGASMNSFVEPAAGERMVLQALVDLYKLGGRFENAQP